MMLSFMYGFITSMSGNFIINLMFVKPHNSNEHRMTELSSYAYGMVGWFYPFLLWVEWYYAAFLSLRRALVTAFVVNSFIFGIAVLMAGIVRKLLYSDTSECL